MASEVSKNSASASSEAVERLEADDVGLLWAMHIIGPDEIWAAPDHATAVKWCAYVNDELAPRDKSVLTVAVPVLWHHDRLSHAAALPQSIEDWSLPTDRRAEAEAPPSAGPDAGLVERLRAVESSRSDSDGTGLRDVTTNWYRNPDGHAAAAALEAAAKERDTWKTVAENNAAAIIQHIDRATRAEAQVADRDKRIAELVAILTDVRRCTQGPTLDARIDQALSAIPAPGRE